MTLAYYIDLMLNGLLTGLVYGLAALGLAVIFGATRIVNLAHGEMMVAGMYGAALVATTRNTDPLMALPLVAAGLFLFGFLLQRGLLSRFVDAPDHQALIVMIGVALLLMNGSLLLFGGEPRGLHPGDSVGTVSAGGFLIDRVRVRAAWVALMVTALLFLFFNFSRTGKALRACADNPFGARAIGLSLPWLQAVAFGLGASVVGVAGCLMALITDARPGLGPDYTLLGLTIVLVGGLGSAGGALAGGMLIGITEGLAGRLMTPAAGSLVEYGLLILVLVWRPQGLAGNRA